MFKAKRNVPLPNAVAMSAALADVRAVQAKYDARLMFLVFLDRAGHVGSQLKALGMETDESLKTLFDSAFEQSKKERAVPKTFNPDAQPTGAPS